MTSKPKIAVIGLKGLPAFGGAASVGENIIEKLKDKYDFTVLSVASHTSKTQTVYKGVRQIVFNNFANGGLNTFIYYLKSLFHVLFNKYDLVHLHHAESGFITPFIKMRSKVIVTFHGIFSYEDPKFSKFQNRFFRFSEKLNVKYANLVVSVSNPDKDFIYNKYNRVIEYIPNGIDTNLDGESLHGDDRKTGYIFFAAGRIYQIKGLHLLLGALKNIKQSAPLLVAGDINQVPAYKVEIDELSSGLNVQYLGLIKNKEKLMNLIKDAQLFVFPSLTEAMSMMLLESVSMKTPVIASDIASNKAIFTDNEMLFFKSMDILDLEMKIRYAIANPREMKEKADLAYEKLTKEYTWDAISKQYIGIYNKLIN